MNHKQLQDINQLQENEFAMRWYGWGSPIGLSIFLLTFVLIAAIIKIVFFG